MENKTFQSTTGRRFLRDVSAPPRSKRMKLISGEGEGGLG